MWLVVEALAQILLTYLVLVNVFVWSVSDLIEVCVPMRTKYLKTP